MRMKKTTAVAGLVGLGIAGITALLVLRKLRQVLETDDQFYERVIGI